MLYLDLEELPELTARGGLISQSHFAGASFRRSDHAGDPDQPLVDAVRDCVERQTGIRPEGPIRLLTQLRYFGYYFSPLNVYYCFDRDGEELQAVVGEVSNIPWREQHCYVLWEGNRVDDGLRFEHDKTFYVSPFMEMNLRYAWRLNQPGRSLTLQLDTLQEGRHFFDATLMLDRRPLTRGQLFRATLRFPLMTAQIVSSIYIQALRLWWKKCPSYPHPKTLDALQTTRS